MSPGLIVIGIVVLEVLVCAVALRFLFVASLTEKEGNDMRLRILHFRGPAGDYVYLTRHFTSDSDDFATKGYQLVSDGTVECDGDVDVQRLPLDTLLIAKK